MLWGLPSLLSNEYGGFLVDKSAEAWSWQSESGAEATNCGAIPQLLHISSWHNAELIKHKDTLYSIALPDSLEP
jgi:hypothetical protein